MTAGERLQVTDFIHELVKNRTSSEEVVRHCIAEGISPEKIVSSYNDLGFWAHLKRIPNDKRTSPFEVAFHISDEPVPQDLREGIEDHIHLLDTLLRKGKVDVDEYESHYWQDPFVDEAENLPHAEIHVEWMR